MLQPIAEVVSSYGAKVLYSALLFSFVFVSTSEIIKLWWDDTLVIRPFEYIKDGHHLRANGEAFARGIAHEQRLIISLLQENTIGEKFCPSSSLIESENGNEAKKFEILKLDHTVLELDMSDFGRVDTKDLGKIKLEVAGLNLPAILTLLRDWMRQPDTLAGRVDEVDGTYHVYAEWPKAKGRRDHPHVYHAPHSILAHAQFNLAAFLLWRELSLKRKRTGLADLIVKQLSPRQFVAFTQIVWLIRCLKSDNPGNIITLDNAMKDIDALIEQGVEFPPVYLAASELRVLGIQRGDDMTVSAVADVVERRKQYVSAMDNANLGAEAVKNVKNWLTKRSSEAIAAVPGPNPVPGDPDDGQLPLVDVAPGSSISVKDVMSTGSVCCIVHSAGKRYLVTADYLIPPKKQLYGNPIPVLVPAQMDGGNTLVGEFESSSDFARLRDTDDGIALIALKEDIVATNGLPDSKTISGVSSNVALGETLRIFGRLYPGQETKVKAVPSGGATDRFSERMIGVDRVAVPGDGGAPVLNSKDELVGIIYASSEQYTFVLPVASIFQERKLRLDGSP